MTRKMQAAMVEQFGNPLQIRGIDVPPASSRRLSDVVANGITIRGACAGNRQDRAAAPGFAAGGKVKADIESQPLSAINNFESLAHGDVPSRVVLDFSASQGH